MRPATHAALLSAALAVGGVAGAGIQKAAAPSQTVELRDVRYSPGGAELTLAVRQGALSGGLRVRCAVNGTAKVAGKPAPSAVALCKATLAVPAAITSDLASLLGQ